MASVVFHGCLLALLGTFWPPLTSISPKRIPQSTPIYVALLTIPPAEASIPKPASPEPPHAIYALKPVHAGGSTSHRMRSTRQVRRTIPIPARIQPRLAMTPHPTLPSPAGKAPKLASADKVISRPAPAEQATLPESIAPPAAHPDTVVAKETAPEQNTATTTGQPALTGPAAPGGGTDSGSPTGSVDGSGTGDKGEANGTGPGTGAGTGSGSGPFGIDAGPGEGPRHIVYVVDISGSMTSRIDVTRQEVVDALDTLTSDESFDVISFSTDVRYFDERLEAGTSGNVSQAKQWLQYQNPDGGTNLQDALTKAIQMPGVNVVVLITDGVPTVGETNFGKIARNIRRRNVNHARIFTIGLIGKNPDGSDDSFDASKLLAQLADDSGGTHKFVELGVSTPD